MTYLGLSTYSATEAELAALPDYRAAMKEHGMYTVPPGRYRYEHRVGVWQIIDVAENPISNHPLESYSRVQIVRDSTHTLGDCSCFMQDESRDDEECPCTCDRCLTAARRGGVRSLQTRDALPLTPLDEEFHFQKY